MAEECYFGGSVLGLEEDIVSAKTNILALSCKFGATPPGLAGMETLEPIPNKVNAN